MWREGAFTFIGKGEGGGQTTKNTRVVSGIRHRIWGCSALDLFWGGGKGGDGRARERDGLSVSDVRSRGGGRERRLASGAGVRPVRESEGGEGRKERDRDSSLSLF